MSRKIYGNLWEEIQYNQDDPSTWVQAGLWPKIRGKVIGTLICPGVGTIIGHQVDLHDRREQDRQNAAKRRAYDQGAANAEMEIARLKQENAIKDLEHQQELNRLEEKRRLAEEKINELQNLVYEMQVRMNKMANDVPETFANVVYSMNIMFQDKIKASQTRDEVEATFNEFCRLLEALLNTNK